MNLQNSSTPPEPSPSLPRHGRRGLQRQGVTLRAFNQLKNSVKGIRNRVSCVHAGSSNRGSNVLQGCNVHIRNGLGQTATTHGRGTLVLGYNEDGIAEHPVERTLSGSHTVVVGSGHTYTGHSGLVDGTDNSVSGQSASVVGGTRRCLGRDVL
jgi:hypothetical protein